jgi:hypothetical protein
MDKKSQFEKFKAVNAEQLAKAVGGQGSSVYKVNSDETFELMPLKDGIRSQEPALAFAAKQLGW